MKNNEKIFIERITDSESCEELIKFINDFLSSEGISKRIKYDKKFIYLSDIDFELPPESISEFSSDNILSLFIDVYIWSKFNIDFILDNETSIDVLPKISLDELDFFESFIQRFVCNEKKRRKIFTRIGKALISYNQWDSFVVFAEKHKAEIDIMHLIHFFVSHSGDFLHCIYNGHIPEGLDDFTNSYTKYLIEKHTSTQFCSFLASYLVNLPKINILSMKKVISHHALNAIKFSIKDLEETVLKYTVFPEKPFLDKKISKLIDTLSTIDLIEFGKTKNDVQKNFKQVAKTISEILEASDDLLDSLGSLLLLKDHNLIQTSDETQQKMTNLYYSISSLPVYKMLLKVSGEIDDINDLEWIEQYLGTDIGEEFRNALFKQAGINWNEVMLAQTWNVNSFPKERIENMIIHFFKSPYDTYFVDEIDGKDKTIIDFYKNKGIAPELIMQSDYADYVARKCYNAIKNNSELASQIIGGETEASVLCDSKYTENFIETDYTSMVICQIKAVERYLKEVLIQHHLDDIYSVKKVNYSTAQRPILKNELYSSTLIWRSKKGYQKLEPEKDSKGNFRRLIYDSHRLNVDDLVSKDGKSLECGSAFYALKYSYRNEKQVPQLLLRDYFLKEWIPQTRNKYAHVKRLENINMLKRKRAETAFWFIYLIINLGEDGVLQN